jgi:myo-inositol-1(or 4)-monophosphatase
MAGASKPRAALDVDWLAACRRAADRVRAALHRFPRTSDREATTGRGEGGDEALVIDRVAEEAIIGELDALGVPLTVVSEELGEAELHGGGPVHVVIDPIDGSLNAKRRLPAHCLSIAVADGDAMGHVELGYVRQLGGGQAEWWARRGEGAWRDGDRLGPLPADAPLELLGVESANPRLVAEAAEAVADSGAYRLRIPGSIALAMCFVASSQLDAMISLAAARSVDVAAGQLIVREAGGTVTFPDAGDPLEAGLSLEMRSRVIAAAHPGLVDRVLGPIDSG